MNNLLLLCSEVWEEERKSPTVSSWVSFCCPARRHGSVSYLLLLCVCPCAFCGKDSRLSRLLPPPPPPINNVSDGFCSAYIRYTWVSAKTILRASLSGTFLLEQGCRKESLEFEPRLVFVLATHIGVRSECITSRFPCRNWWSPVTRQVTMKCFPLVQTQNKCFSLVFPSAWQALHGTWSYLLQYAKTVWTYM